jgi:hypothetical protein
MQEVINLTAPIVKFAHQKLTLEELGKEIAEVLSLHPDYANQPRLQRIHDKFASVEDEERFDAFMLDLASWCEYNRCQLVMPGNQR